MNDIAQLLKKVQNERPSKDKPYTLQMVYSRTNFDFKKVMPSMAADLLIDIYVRVNADPEHNLHKASMDVWRSYFRVRETDRFVPLIERIDQEGEDLAPEAGEPLQDIPSKLEMALYALLARRGLLERLAEVGGVRAEDIHQRFNASPCSQETIKP